MRRRAVSFHLTAALLGPVLLAGCGDGGPKRVKVSGKVLLDGKPVTHGSLQVLPQGFRASAGTIQEDGTFVLSCYEEDDGVVLGTHPIVVNGAEPISLYKIKWHLPKRFANSATCNHQVEITGPTDDLIIELESGSKKPFNPFVEVLWESRGPATDDGGTSPGS